MSIGATTATTGRFTTVTSTQATGTAPFTVASTTVVTNLNADLLDGFNSAQASTVSTVAVRDASGDIVVRLVRSEFANEATISGAMAFRVNNSTDNFVRFCSDTPAIRTFLNVPTRTGGDATGTWAISITGNAGTATSATNATNVAVTPSATASAFKVPFANTTASTTGNYGLLQDSEATFTYNPSTNTLVAGTFSGALSGNATTATTATSANQLGGVAAANFPRTGADNNGDWNFAANVSAADYTRAAIELRELNFAGAQSATTAVSPRLSFHWGGRVASQIGLETSGRIAILNNPGTGYEAFICGTFTASSITETSSIAYKENVNPIDSALDKVLQLIGVTYDRKDGSSKNEAGLIAEDVAKVLPNIVSEKEGKPEGIQYTKLTAYLIECIKELNAKIERLEGKS
jgi:hypothetical protein